jgi:hypothetical protein
MATNTWPMSALGHKWTYAVQKAMSALPSIADIRGYDRNVRFLPIADITPLIRSSARPIKGSGIFNPSADELIE